MPSELTSASRHLQIRFGRSVTGSPTTECDISPPPPLRSNPRLAGSARSELPLPPSRSNSLTAGSPLSVGLANFDRTLPPSWSNPLFTHPWLTLPLPPSRSNPLSARWMRSKLHPWTYLPLYCCRGPTSLPMLCVAILLLAVGANRHSVAALNPVDRHRTLPQRWTDRSCSGICCNSGFLIQEMTSIKRD